MTTDERGVATATNIPLGRISVVETKAPEGYRLDPTVHTYEVSGSQLGTSGVFELSPKEGYGELPQAFDIEVVKYLESGNEAPDCRNRVPKYALTSSRTRPAKPSAPLRPTTAEERRAPAGGSARDRASTASRAPSLYDRKGYTVHEDPAARPRAINHARLGNWDRPDGRRKHVALHRRQ